MNSRRRRTATGSSRAAGSTAHEMFYVCVRAVQPAFRACWSTTSETQAPTPTRSDRSRTSLATSGASPSAATHRPRCGWRSGGATSAPNSRWGREPLCPVATEWGWWPIARRGSPCHFGLGRKTMARGSSVSPLFRVSNRPSNTPPWTSTVSIYSM